MLSEVNTKAIDAALVERRVATEKSDQTTKETISSLQELFQSTIIPLREQINAITSRLDRGEGANKGSVDVRTERAQSIGMMVGISTVAALGISMLISAVLFVSLHITPSPPARSEVYIAPPTASQSLVPKS